MPRNANSLIDTAELAKHLGIQPSTVRAWVRAGRIPAVRITPKVIRFDIGDVIKSLKMRKV